MTELLIIAMALTAMIMFSGMIKRGIESFGRGVQSLGGAASHIVDAGADQAIRARIISADSKEDTKLSSVKLASERETTKTEFMKKLTAPQTTSVKIHSDWLNTL